MPKKKSSKIVISIFITLIYYFLIGEYLSLYLDYFTHLKTNMYDSQVSRKEKNNFS